MTDLEKLRQWLLTYPGGSGLVHIDHTDGVPGNSGLFPAGVEEVRRREDVLGNVTVDCRCRFTLHRVTALGQDNEEAARWLLAFQEWVRAQSLAGLAPTFGDDPARERIRAEKGRLYKASQSGTGTYSVTLTVDFVKYY